jgi:hypothetical protein
LTRSGLSLLACFFKNTPNDHYETGEGHIDKSHTPTPQFSGFYSRQDTRADLIES